MFAKLNVEGIMKFQFIPILFVFLAILYEKSGAQSTTADFPPSEFLISNGFVDGNKYMTLSESDKAVYVIGVADGLLGSPILYQNNSERERRLLECLRGKSSHQLKDSLTLYLEKNPFIRDSNASVSFVKAIDEHCEILRSN